MSFAEPGLQIVPGLTLLRPLGRGGMGEAWLARDDERGEEVAAKVLPPDAPAEHLALLRREARLGKRLSHPRIVPVYDLRSGSGGTAVTLRYMRGGAAVWRGGVPPSEVVRLGRDVAEALEYLHGQGIVHRDVKASNILLDEAGRAHLADFGIAAVPQGDEEGLVLRGGGSRASMSPQQRAGEPSTPADDLYALGAFLFELLSGWAPFPPDVEESRSRAQRVTSPFPCPDSLANLVASLLEKSPSKRPASARVVSETLAAIEAELAGAPSSIERARPAVPPVRLQPPPRVADGDFVAPAGLDAPRPRTRGGLSFAQMNLLAGLFLAALVTVVWLPGWVGPPAAKPQTVAPPAPVPSETATLKPTPPPATVQAPAEVLPAKASSAARVARTAATPAGPPTLAPEAPSISTPPVEPTPNREAEARTLARHRDAARAFEEKEEWSAALREYEAALALDPFVTFAIEGKDRTRVRAALQAALDFHLRNNARLSTESVALEAQNLIERAKSIDSPGPRQLAQIAALERAIADARTTVTVQLESDGLTDLTVSSVGRLGTLTHKSVQLRPGKYTVVGSRRGYRDVRREFTIAPGSLAQTVVVRCEEVI